MTRIGRDWAKSSLGGWLRVDSVAPSERAGCNEKWGYALRSPREFIYNPTAPWGEVVSREVFGTKGPGECIAWDSTFETPSLPSFRDFLLRSATVKLGLKVGLMLSSLVLSFACFVGCNSDETAPAKDAGPGATKPDAGKPGAAAPVKPDDKTK